MARVLVFTTNGETKEIECNTLDDYYKELNCSTFDIVRRRVGNKMFDIFVDDEGLLKCDPVITMIGDDFKPMLVGNLIFANSDSEENTTSLSDDDVKLIKDFVMHLYNIDTGETRKVIWGGYGR